jgi:trans-aconitate 2-methyltransferase
MRKVAERPAFRDKLSVVDAAREPIGVFRDYIEALTPLCASVDIWRTTYVHRLAGPDAIVEWVKGTGLRPYLEPLDTNERAGFLAQYRAEIARAYPPLANGDVLLPFPRLFIVAARPRS